VRVGTYRVRELEPNNIDFVIVAASTPDGKVPSFACIARAKMGH